MTCAVTGCINSKNSLLSPGVWFHSFPDRLKRPKDYQSWVEKIKNKNVHSSSLVCSIHFEDGDYVHNLSVCNCVVSKKARRRLRSGVVPHLNLEVRELEEAQIAMLQQLNKIEPSENTIKEEKCEGEDFETVYLPSADAELFHENSDSEESNASSDHDSSMFNDVGVSFPNRILISRAVQCEFGTEKYRRRLGKRCANESCSATTEYVPCSATGDSMSEDLAGIVTAPDVSLPKPQEIQCELGAEVYRWRLHPVLFKTKRYVCLSGGDCPCDLPKRDGSVSIHELTRPGAYGNRIVKSRINKDAVENQNTFKNENNELDRNSVDDNAFLVCENYYNGPSASSRTVQETDIAFIVWESDNGEPSDNNRTTQKSPPPKPTFVNVTDLPQKRQKVESIIRKRSLPNILRRNRRTK